jgi:PAS domain S-box-containing protein
MKSKRSLRFRFLLVISSILAVATLVTSLAIAINERITNRSYLRSEGKRLASYIALLSREALITKDTVQLDAIVNEANNTEDIAYVFIRNEGGTYLTSPYASINYRIPRIHDILLESSRGQKFQDIIQQINIREPVIEISAPITMGLPILGVKNIGTVTIGLTEYKMRRDIARTLFFVIIFSLGGAIILGLVLFFASKNIILDPLTELAQASSRLAQGDLSTEVGMKTMGEVKTLVDSFNKMVRNLEKVTVSRDYVDNILKSMTNTLLVVSSDNQIMSTNTATCELLGYDEKELVGQPLGIIKNSEDQEREKWMRNLLADGHIGNIEEIYRTKDGGSVPVLLSASVMRDEHHLLRGIIYVAQDITERKRAENSLKESEERLRSLASQLIDAQELERKRIARELHDDLGQSLLLLKLKLSSMSRGLPPDLEKLRQECHETVENVQEIIDAVRCLSQDLIPPMLAEIGLNAAVKELLEEFCQRHDIASSLDIDDMEGLFSQEMELNIYRILQESLTNIGRYSQATRLSVSLKRKDPQVCLSVEDNGQGFEVSHILGRSGRTKGLGLSSMEERARMMGGTFHLWSKPMAGTKIEVTVPLRMSRLP